MHSFRTSEVPHVRYRVHLCLAYLSLAVRAGRFRAGRLLVACQPEFRFDEPYLRIHPGQDTAHYRWGGRVDRAHLRPWRRSFHEPRISVGRCEASPGEARHPAVQGVRLEQSVGGSASEREWNALASTVRADLDRLCLRMDANTGRTA